MLFRFLILVHVCATFPLKCPKPAQWSTRARGVCADPSKYFCLKNDLINGYSENCTVFDFLQPGRKNVLRGGLDADICSSERYQPWPIKFFTNISSNCIFLKSTCNEEGQVVYSNGNRNTDITCRCDYTRGYDFIVKPRKPCFCVPSEEDCSCYLKMCHDSSFVLSPDYGCINSKKNISINQCKSIIYERINRKLNQNDIEDILRIRNISTAEKYIHTVAILVTSISLVAIFVSYPFAEVFAKWYKDPTKYTVPLEIQNMDKKERDRYIKILKTGTEKMYSIKIMILGKKRVGKTSLMKNLLQKKFNKKEPPTDGIDIVTTFKVDIDNKQWIYCKNDTTDERVGRALRKQGNEPDSLSQSRKTNTSCSLEMQNTTQSQITSVHDVQMERDEEGTKVSSNVLNETSVKNIKQDTDISNVSKTKEGNSQKYVSEDIENGKEEENNESDTIKYIKPTETDDIDTVLRKGLNAKVDNNKFADCIIMDFAGQKEYYSTHQTFLTRNAVYLVVFSLIEGDPFTEAGDDEDNLGFWIDNIHCYGKRKHNDGQDEKDGGLKCTISQTQKTDQEADKHPLNAQILMVCTGDDNPDDSELKQKKSEWEEKFKTLRLMNKRDPLVWGHVNYISNTNPSASDFKTLKDRIVKIAETSPNWGEDYPVTWINLEKVLGRERTKGNNVLSVKDVKEMAMNCSVPIRQEKEVILFLKFQHERGNLIFFDEKELRNCIILDPSWLSDAFKCIVFADECTKDSHQQSTLPEFRQNGKITKALLRKMIEHKNPKYKGHFNEVVSVMTKFDIIVMDKQDSFICPSVITRKAVSFKTICDKENINKTSCFRSPWLCIEFNFLPPALFNHLLVFCMRDKKCFENAELFNEIGIFCIKGSTDLDKFFLCKSGRTIALQIFTRNEIVQNAQSLYKTILHTLTTITSKYGYTVYYTPKILCGETDYSSDKGRHLFDDIKRNGFGYCYHCKDKHTAEYYSVWFKEDWQASYITKDAPNEDTLQAETSLQKIGSESDENTEKGEDWQASYITKDAPNEDTLQAETSLQKIGSESDENTEKGEEEVEEEHKNKGHRKCNYCKHMSVYKCYDCNQVLCRDCSRKHGNAEKYSKHLMQLISDSFILNCKLPLGDGIYGIQDIICLPDGEVVAAVYNNKDIPELLVFSISGKRRHVIQLDKIPQKVDVVDKNTVAVLFDGNIVAIVDIQQNHVQYIRHILMFYGSGTSLIYIENELYLGYGRLIVVIDLSGNVKRRYTLSFTPCSMCYNLDSQPLRIYCIDRDNSQLVCIDRDGTIIFTFTDPSMTNLTDLTIDNEGNVLVLCEKGNDNPGYVIKVDSNGDNSEVVITNMNTSVYHPHICYDHSTNSVVIVLDDTVYFYKRKA